MPMPVVNIREMGVLVGHGSMLVPVRVALAGVPGKVVLMGVVLVMCMVMGMGQCFMQVRMLVPLGQMQPYPQAHETAC